MIVRLTHTQGRVVTQFLGGRHAELMVKHRVAYGRKQHDYLLPAIGWRQVLDKMKGEAYGPLGGHLKDRPKSFYTAMSRVQGAVSVREHHPALTHKAVFGVETELIPSWRCDWFISSPYPEPDAEFELLVPRTSEVSGHTITDWIAGDWLNSTYPLHPGDTLDFVTPSRVE